MLKKPKVKSPKNVLSVLKMRVKILKKMKPMIKMTMILRMMMILMKIRLSIQKMKKCPTRIRKSANSKIL